MDRQPKITYYIRVKGRRLSPTSCRIELVKSIVHPAIYEKDVDGIEIITHCRTYNEEIQEIPAEKCVVYYSDTLGWVADILNIPIETKIEAAIKDPIEANVVITNEDKRIEKLFTNTN